MVLAYRQNYAALKYNPEAAPPKPEPRVHGNKYRKEPLAHYNEERQHALVRRIKQFVAHSGMPETKVVAMVSGEGALMSAIRRGRRLRGSTMGRIEDKLLELEQTQPWVRDDG